MRRYQTGWSPEEACQRLRSERKMRKRQKSMRCCQASLKAGSCSELVTFSAAAIEESWREGGRLEAFSCANSKMTIRKQVSPLREINLTV
jgi:hypothetical protein